MTSPGYFNSVRAEDGEKAAFLSAQLEQSPLKMRRLEVLLLMAGVGRSMNSDLQALGPLRLSLPYSTLRQCVCLKAIFAFLTNWLHLWEE